MTLRRPFSPIKLRRKAAHDAQMPSEVSTAGAPDPVPLTHALEDDRMCLTKNHDDFWLLHNLIKQAGGHHPGIFVVRQDNDPTRDLTPKWIVSAIRKQAGKSGVPIQDEFIVLSHWR
jgi:hypothetical protein